jgi:hypothetical protein
MAEKISEGWDGADRRSIPIHVLTHVSEVMDQFRQEEKERHKKLDEDMQARFELIEDRFDLIEGKLSHITHSIDAFMARTENVIEGFPGKDPDGHRRAHEEWLSESRAKKEFYEKLKQELAKYGLLALVGWIGLLIWNGFLRGPQ